MNEKKEIVVRRVGWNVRADGFWIATLMPWLIGVEGIC